MFPPVTSCSTNVSQPGSFPCSELFIQAYDLCPISYPGVFMSLLCNILSSIVVCAAANLYFVRWVSAHVSAPNAIDGNTHWSYRLVFQA